MCALCLGSIVLVYVCVRYDLFRKQQYRTVYHPKIAVFFFFIFFFRSAVHLFFDRLRDCMPSGMCFESLLYCILYTGGCLLLTAAAKLYPTKNDVCILSGSVV